MAETKKQFKLSEEASRKLNKYLGEIRKGIKTVCELHEHDSHPSMEKTVFEEAYIERLLGQTVAAVSLSIKGMMEGLQAQKQAEVQVLKESNQQPAEDKEDKQ